MGDPRKGLARLRAAAADGRLAELSKRYGVILVTVFGSVLDDERQPRDLDLAVYFDHTVKPDVLGVINELMTLTGIDEIDLLHLNRARVVARNNALTYGEPLYTGQCGIFGRLQMAAATELAETAWMREAQLELFASGRRFG